MPLRPNLLVTVYTNTLYVHTVIIMIVMPNFDTNLAQIKGAVRGPAWISTKC